MLRIYLKVALNLPCTQTGYHFLHGRTAFDFKIIQGGFPGEEELNVLPTNWSVHPTATDRFKNRLLTTKSQGKTKQRGTIQCVAANLLGSEYCTQKIIRHVLNGKMFLKPPGFLDIGSDPKNLRQNRSVKFNDLVLVLNDEHRHIDQFTNGLYRMLHHVFANGF